MSAQTENSTSAPTAMVVDVDESSRFHALYQLFQQFYAAKDFLSKVQTTHRIGESLASLVFSYPMWHF
jgi:hypothetical protein